MKGIDGKAAIVSGSSQGIGKACARRLADLGAAVVLNGRKPEPLEATADELRARGGRVTTVAGSIGEADMPARLVAAAVETFGRIDFLVSNAAMVPYAGPMMGASGERFGRAIGINAWASVALAQHAMPAGLADGGGAIVNVSAGGARLAVPDIAEYNASKAALESLTRSLAVELGPLGVRVNAVAPGLVRTAFAEPLLAGGREQQSASNLPLRRIGEPDDVAGAVVFLLSDEASWITGVVLDVDGGNMLTR